MSIFISYRRSDGDFALLLYAWLTERFGRERVFWDKEDIDPGQDWAEVLRSRVKSAKALVALIGHDWATVTDDTGRRRLESPRDWVRAEIAAALVGGALVLPVLTTGTANLREDELPDDLRALARTQSLSMSDSRFHTRLIEALDRVVYAAPAPAAAPADEPGFQDLLQQVQSLQIRAVELIQEGRPDQATHELNEGFRLMMPLVERTTHDVNLDVHLGYLYKTVAQTLGAARQEREAERYRSLAFSVLQRVKDAEAVPSDVRASAWNGLGNIYHLRGHADEAIRHYLEAVRLSPDYAYSWHDLVLAYDDRAHQGHLDLPAMKHALARMLETARGAPGLGEDDLAGMRTMVARWEPEARRTRGPRRR
jgi:tetratricopeptide (TPR) repeat protein